MKNSAAVIARASSNLALGLLLTASAVCGELPSSSSSTDRDSTKPYTLYLGVNFSVEYAGQLRPVQDVDGNAFVVMVDGRRVTVPSYDKKVKLKLDDSLKVTPVSATIANYKAERAYTADSDPNRKLGEAAGGAMSASAVADGATNNLREAQTRLGLEYATKEFAAGGGPGAEVLPLPDNATDGQRAAVESTALAQGSSLNSVGDAASAAAAELARERFDALALTFEVSAPRPLTKPYMIAVARYREDPDRPETARTWVYAQALARVDSTPRKVRMLRGGFPPGYKLEDVRVHLFDAGTELATSIARKRVGITAEEAFQFAIVEYIEQHRGATLEPTLANATVPTGVRSRLAPEKLTGTFYLKVAKNGKPAGVFRDQACGEKVTDPEVESALMGLRFNPALKNGKAVEGVAPVQPAQLSF